MSMSRIMFGLDLMESRYNYLRDLLISPYLVTVFCQFTYEIVVLVPNSIDLIQDFSLNTLRMWVTSGPLRGVVVLGTADVVKRWDLHVTVQRHYFALLDLEF